jgi:hypothetical protein
VIIKLLSVDISRPTLSVLVAKSKDGEYLGLLKGLEEYGNAVMRYLSGARYDNGASSQRHCQSSEWNDDREKTNDFDDLLN